MCEEVRRSAVIEFLALLGNLPFNCRNNIKKGTPRTRKGVVRIKMLNKALADCMFYKDSLRQYS